MKTSIINTEVWEDEEVFALHLDSKLLYLYIISSPKRGSINIYKWSQRFACSYTGMNESQIGIALAELTVKGFVEIYEGYICILKSYNNKLGGPYGDTFVRRDFENVPEEVRLHFYPDFPTIGEVKIKVERPKNNKRGPTPETVGEIVAKQPEVLRQALADFVEDRKERKKPPTTRAVRGWIAKLDKMYPNNYTKQAASIEQSIERGWMGLFEVKEDNIAERKFL